MTNIVRFGEVTSTQDEAKRLVDAGAPDGTVVVASRQTAGRGRRGRAWLSTDDALLILSVGGGNLEKQLSPNLVAAVRYAKSVGATVTTSAMMASVITTATIVGAS